MKLARVRYGERTRIGVVTGDRIGLLSDTTTDLHDLVTGDVPLPEPGALPTVLLDEVTLLAPIVPRRNIMCVGKNYSEHAREFARSGYEAGATDDIDPYPALFSKLPSTVIGPGERIRLHPQVTQKVDYEAELAVIIGPGGTRIPKTAAYDHVWGYTILNDVTARDLQRNHKQWFLGKSLDSFAPMGPWIVTADEVDPEALQVVCKVNGDERQNANTRDLIFDIPTLIETLSGAITLMPGDVIATGTPAGVGLGLDPPQFLKPGDRVEISISGIGTLENVCA
jgi:2-keto-4-pentenoate hydratase/2-oxohepta-3-ene-1,7-dioic acid hydratase in catechol pathway